MKTLRHAILGLPESGKTTFLAALWHVLDAGEIEPQLKLKRLVGNNKYLNVIAEAWRKCEPVPRTSAAAEETVTIYVEDKDHGGEIILSFPDLSGESFERQFEYRSCPEDYVQGFESGGGILLFLSADRGLEGMRIVDMPGEAEPLHAPDSAQAPEAAPAQGKAAKEPEYPAWTPGSVPEQAQLVDLLQMLQARPFRQAKRRLAVVISAWDVVTDAALSPALWLERERSLLSQFLRNNSESFEVQIYGLSAQGGGLSPANKVQLLAMTPSERIKCVTPTTTSHDLTAPLVWLSEAG